MNHMYVETSSYFITASRNVVKNDSDSYYNVEFPSQLSPTGRIFDIPAGYSTVRITRPVLKPENQSIIDPPAKDSKSRVQLAGFEKKISTTSDQNNVMFQQQFNCFYQYFQYYIRLI